MSNWLFCVCFFCFSSSIIDLQAQIVLSGRITDEKNLPIAYVSIYEAGTSIGTVSNEQGFYNLSLQKGSKKITFQQLGYQSQTVSLDINENTEFNITLTEESYGIEEIEIKAGEDPSIAIIKKAINKRKDYKNKKENYEAELYIKGLIKLTDAPNKVLGQDVGDLGGTLDSNRQGILYLSESLSKIYVQSPNHYKEVMISSKVSGDDRGISANQFSYANFNFYNENIELFRSVVSPIADNALQFYDFFLYEEIVNQLGKKTYKIKMRPKSVYRPCFSGFIYINEDLFNIHSIDVAVTGKALKNPVFDTIFLNQVFIPFGQDDDWRIFNQTIRFNASVFAFKTSGAFSYVFKNYLDNPTLDKSFFNSEIFAVKDEAIVNDTAFWNANRPVPLTKEENQDYIKKDSIAIVLKSDKYRDSIDRKNNAFRLTDLIFGKTYQQSKQKLYYGYTSPINTISFNAVEGTTVSFKPFVYRDNEDGISRFYTKAAIRYGFTDKKIKYSLQHEWNYDPKHLGKITFAGGNDYFQYNEIGNISVFGNTFQSLLYKNNVALLFKKIFGEVRLARELVNSLSFDLGIQYNQRNNLSNNSDFSWFNKNKSYLPNNPLRLNDDQFNINDRQFKYMLSLRWAPFQKYQSYPTYKNRIPSDWPTLYVQLENALPLDDQYSDYLKLKFLLVDNYVGTRIFGYSRYRVEAGKFLYNRHSTIIDAFHFRGNNLFSGFKSPYMQTFKLQNEYEFSSTNPYFAFWYEHHFDGYLFDKIPLLNKSGLTEVISFSSLIRDDIRYFEPGIGIEGIKLGAIDLMRIDYFWSIQNGSYKDGGIRIGFSTFFENILR